jgi:hypothetical protein
MEHFWAKIDVLVGVRTVSRLSNERAYNELDCGIRYCIHRIDRIAPRCKIGPLSPNVHIIMHCNGTVIVKRTRRNEHNFQFNPKENSVSGARVLRRNCTVQETLPNNANNDRHVIEIHATARVWELSTVYSLPFVI